MSTSLLRVWVTAQSRLELLGERLTRPQRGAAMVEYGLIVALISLVAMVGVKFLGTTIGSVFQSIAGRIAGV